MREGPPLILHLVFTLRMGGLENGLVNIVNRTPPERFRHAIVSLTDYDSFAERIERDDVPVMALAKRPGHDLAMYGRLWRLLRRLRPALVHTRNFGTFDTQACAVLARVPARVHGEHGRDMFDLHHTNRRHLAVRRALRRAVDRYVALSEDLEDYLVHKVGVSPRRVVRICNGVDVVRFTPRRGGRAFPPEAAIPDEAIVIGSVGRMAEVKDPLNLARAFNLVVAARPDARSRLRLVMIGGGALHEAVRAEIDAAGNADLAWLPGPRDDVPALLRSMDLFALPSLAEGISNTVLEAMACGLPVVATDVGGNAELIAAGETGALVPAASSEALADALLPYVDDASLREGHGRASRARAEQRFSLDGMVGRYLDLYEELLCAGS